MAAAADASDLPAVVVCVHGTFAYNDEDEASPKNPDRWWQRNSAFSKKLQTELGNGYVVLPFDASTTSTLGNTVFHWSGANRETARRNAGRLLFALLKKLEAQKRPYHVIAHSHGGALLWEALDLASIRSVLRFWVRDPSTKYLPKLTTCTTVGTPFLHFAPDLVGLFALITLLALGLVLRRQWSWIADYWEQFAIDVDATWWIKMLAVQVAYAGLIITPCLLFHLAYRFYRLWSAQADPRPQSDAPQGEFLLTLLALKWTVVFILLLRLTAGYVGVFDDLYPVAAAATRGISPVLVSVYLWWAMSCGIVCVILLGTVLWQLGACLVRRLLRQYAWSTFADRYWCVASVEHDEAIRGLASIVRGIKGPLLPRLPAPGFTNYSPNNGRFLEPEQKSQSWLHYLFLPLFIIRDWFIRPIYNEVVAKLLDAFVLRRLTRQAQGADIQGLRLGIVSPTPVVSNNLDIAQSWRFGDWWSWRFVPRSKTPSPGSRRHGPSADNVNAICTTTETHAGGFLRQLRNQLGVVSPAATSLTEFLRRAMDGERNAMDLLVHTQYFDHEGIVKELANCIRKEHPNPPNGADSAPDLSVRGHRDTYTEPLPVEFLWSIVRAIVIIFGLCLPALVLQELGRSFVYPYSREANLRWASAKSPAVAAAASRLDALGQSPKERYSPLFIRWLAGLHITGRSAEADEFTKELQTHVRNPFEFAVVRAATAEKLAELGLGNQAAGILSEVRSTLPDSPSTEEDKLRFGRIETAEKYVVSPTRPNVGQRPSAEPRFQPLWSLADEVTSEKFDPEKTEDFVSRVQRQIAEFKDDKEPRHLLNALNIVLIIHQSLLERNKLVEADTILAAATSLSDRQERLRSQLIDDDQALMVIECYLLLAKSCRWPNSKRQQGIGFLEKAEQCARSGLKPLNEVNSLARVAAGYARLGYFPKARSLADAADAEHRLFVAKEMLANEYERQKLRNLGTSITPEEPAQVLAIIRIAMDEQLDVYRSEYDGPR